MTARLNIFENELVMKASKHFNTAGRLLAESSFPLATQELVKLRASQINGCGFCTDMHYKDAIEAGEDPLRLNLVATWREATCFTDAERAALGVAEQGTRIADAHTGVSDEAWEAAAKHYTADELGALIMVIAVINMYNRLNVINQQPAGDYKPGQFG